MSMKKESPWDVELHLAAAKGDAKRLQVLLESGRVHVDCKDKDGTTPLILAAAGGHSDAVGELLEQGADPAAKRLTGTTALFFASQGGFVDVVNLLLDHGALVDSCSVDGGTPLFVACQCGHLDVVEGLLDRGANVNAHMKDGATALFIASQNGHVRILEVLLERGAKTDAIRTDGATPLWIAAQMGHDHVVRRLLKAGARVDSTRHDGATPLFKAAHKGHSSVIGELLKYRPSLGILPNGESALHAAALSGHMGVARQLVGAGADPLLLNQEGVTPLQLAIRHSQTQVIDYLTDKFTDKKDDKAYTLFGLILTERRTVHQFGNIMTRDRLPDLYAARKHSASFGTGFLQDVHIQISQNKKLNKVLDEVEEIRTLIQLIADNSNVIKELHNNVLSYNNRDIQAELDTRTQVISETASRVQRKLKDMEKDITLVEDLSMDTAKDGPIHLRIKILQHSTMFRLFSEVMRDYNESLLRYQDKYTSLIYQQKLLTKKNCTPEELQQMLDSRETNLFVDNILQDSNEVRRQLSDLQTRHEEFLKLEKSIVEVRDMFTEMAFLVEKQGERLNCVEYFAGKATDNVDNGRVVLNDAEVKGRKYKKRKIKIIIIVCIVILVLILIAVYL